jgi:hypothetical protein
MVAQSAACINLNMKIQVESVTPALSADILMKKKAAAHPMMHAQLLYLPA